MKTESKEKQRSTNPEPSTQPRESCHSYLAPAPRRSFGATTSARSSVSMQSSRFTRSTTGHNRHLKDFYKLGPLAESITITLSWGSYYGGSDCGSWGSMGRRCEAATRRCIGSLMAGASKPSWPSSAGAGALYYLSAFHKTQNKFISTVRSFCSHAPT